MKDLGEFEIIRKIRQKTRAGLGVIQGIGDDAAVLSSNASKDVLFTTDMLVEDKHFILREASAFEIGWKALAVNISDIAAMGGMPTSAVISVGLPPDLPESFVDEFYRGIQALARKFGVSIVGGDTNASEKLVICVSLLGECEKSKAVYRSQAKEGDVVFVTGLLGGSYESRKHLTFTPRVREARFLTRYFKVHAMMDISDGLAGDARRIAEESRVGILICREAVPVSEAAGGVESALSDGEDFELLFTLSSKDAARLSFVKHGFGREFFRPVGKVVHKKYGVCLVGASGIATPVEKAGFDHFS